MASDFGSNGPRFESGRGRCVESLDKALYSHCPKEKPSHYLLLAIWTNFQNKNIFQPPQPILRYHSSVQNWLMFMKNTLWQLSCKCSDPQNSTFFAMSMKNIPNGVWWEFPLFIPLDGVVVIIFVLHSFPCFNDLEFDNTITMGTRMVSFDLDFCQCSEKVVSVNFHDHNCEQGFCILNLKH